MNNLLNLKNLTMFGWTVAVLFSMLFAAYIQYQHSYKIAYDVASANFDKDQAFRQWASSHGGVYVPVEMQRTPPSPYLKHIPERDITTVTGKKLTLMNPAYMMRQMIDEYSGLYGARGHITALEILNPKSIADEWEKKALKTFRNDNSVKEVIELIQKDSKSYLRLMRPMEITAGCLNCHGHQSTYLDSKTAGGVSVTIPMSEIYAVGIDSFSKTASIHFIFWLIGMFLFRFVYKKEKLAKDKLEYFATHDSLTSLPNRYACQNKIVEILQDNKKDKNLYLLFMDLDNFKTINDSLGHSVGDLLLQNVSSRLRDEIDEFKMFSRFGGDEFIFIFSDVQDAKFIEKSVEKILQAFRKPFVLMEHEVYTSVSIGISCYPDNSHSEESLLKNADIAMYHAKRTGKNNYSFYHNDMISVSQNRLILESALHRALEKQELFLLYQPQISLVDEKLLGVEALIRWNHPKLGLVSPIEFIPIAENNGLIMPIGQWIIDEACEQLSSWRDTKMKDITISINISAKQILYQDLYTYIKLAVERTGIDVRLLELEITESVIMENINETIEILSKLKKLGVTIAIDDFGTGYSSLSYLKKLPIDKLKIDREFIKDIPADKDDIAIINAIISLAKSLNLKIIAEGPETKEHIAFLKEAKCDIAQGYYYSKPIPPESIEEFLN